MPLDYSLEPFKEPRGFLKILQWLFAICAFATTVNFSTDFGFTVSVRCSVQANVTNTTNVTITHTASYPFALDHELQVVDLALLEPCKDLKDVQVEKLTVGFISNVKSDSQFFVTTGVLCFLYATALTGVYLFADKMYDQNTNVPIIDFIFTLIFAIFWLSGSAAWANGLSDLRAATNPDHWGNATSLFSPDELVTQPFKFIETRAGVFGGLVISILFGFINFILWAANLWFLYKETTWFESIMKNSAPSTSATTSGA